MKKIIILFVSVFVLGTFSLHSQSLTNTKWYLASISTYIGFSTDKLSMSADNITYNDVSSYKTVGNNFYITDLVVIGACADTDTGKYTFVLTATTLTFSTVDDPCASRNTALGGAILTKVTASSIADENTLPQVNVYPNPSKGMFTVELDPAKVSEIKIINIVGETIYTQKITTYKTEIDLGNVSKGIYFLQTVNGKAIATKKIVVE
jgi:hypothetical protein